MSAPHDRLGPPDATPAGTVRPATDDKAVWIHRAETDRAETDRAETDRAETDLAHVAGPVAEVDADRSPRRTTCQYLRRVDADDTLGRPFDGGSDANHCIAMGEPSPLSERQQALVCLTVSHEDCPRYLRAMLAIPMVEPVPAPRRRVHPATLVAIALLAVSVVVAVAFTAALGGIAMPSVSTTPNPSASELAAASPSPSIAPSGAPSQSPPASPTMAASPSPSASSPPSASPSPSTTAQPSSSATATPSPSASPRPTSDRYELLERCPDLPDCYVYTVRGGDNLVSIANYFGVPLETVYRLNPWARTTGLRPGQHLILPPPTR